jgi:hypothetical protein
MAVAGGSAVSSVIEDMGSGEMAHLQGWGELGGSNMFWWCSDGPGSVFCRF